MLAALLGLAVAGALVPPKHAARLVCLGCIALCAVATLLDFAFLVSGARGAALTLPIGLPGGATVLALDGLSGFFLLLVMLAATACAAAALDALREFQATLPLFPLFVAVMGLTLLAGDALALAIGFGAMTLTSCALVLTAHRDEGVRPAARSCAGIGALGFACLIAALAVLGQGTAAAGPSAGWGFDFAAMRAHPPAGWRAALVLALTLVGAGSTAGMVPLHVWLPPALAAAPAPAAALMSGAATKVALYMLIRLLFDLCGPAQPPWWGLPLLVLGAGGALLGGWRANMEGDMRSILGCSTVAHVGLILVGIGLALAARGTDLPSLATLALGGALLLAFAHGMFKPLLFIAASAARNGTGTSLLRGLGGLVTRMPMTTAAMLVGGACLAGLPPSSGFAGEWMLFQAAFAAPHLGGLGVQVLVCAAILLMALGAALGAAAAVRLIGVGFLGRPRSPRAAAAEEAGAPTRAAMIGLAAISGLIGLFPGAVLALAAPALRLLVGTTMASRSGGLLVSVCRRTHRATRRLGSRCCWYWRSRWWPGSCARARCADIG